MMQLVRSKSPEASKTARDGLTMAHGPRDGHAAPGLTFAQGFRPAPDTRPLAPGLRLVARHGQRLDI